MTTESSHSVIETPHIHEAPCRESCTGLGMRHIFSLSSRELGVSLLLMLSQQSLSHMACLDEDGVRSWVNYMGNRTQMLWPHCANPQNPGLWTEGAITEDGVNICLWPTQAKQASCFPHQRVFIKVCCYTAR